MAAGLNFELPGAVFGTSVPPPPLPRQCIQEPVADSRGLGSLRRPGGKVWCANVSALVGQVAMAPEQLEEVLWKQFFADTTQWWDNRRSKPTPRHPDFRHKQFKVPLWLNSRHKPLWVDSQLATMDAGEKTFPDMNIALLKGPGALTATEGHVQVGMCRKLCEDGPISEALDALDLLAQRGCHIPNNLFYRVLKRCIQDKDLALGRRLHALTVRSGYEGDAFLSTHLISLYASHGKLDEAMGVFTKVSTPDAYNWATIIFAYARHGDIYEAAEAVRLYRQMRKSTSINPDDLLYAAVLKACAASKDLIAGREVHTDILASSAEPGRFVQAGLVNMYAKCGSIEDARRLFDNLSNRNVVTWTAMIAGYAQQGRGQEALGLYRSMRKEGITLPNSVTYLCLLQACATVGIDALDEGKQLHAEIRKRGLQDDVALGGSLVKMYAKCGSFDDASSLFHKLPDRSVVAWNAMIAGYSKLGMGQEALSLYKSMQLEGVAPNTATFVCMLQACASAGVRALGEGMQLHAQIKEQGLEVDAVLGGSVVNMYAKCSRLEEARNVFDKLWKRDVVTWTVMIAGYVERGMGQEALVLYRRMREEGLTPPDSVTYVCLLQACAGIGVEALDDGKHLHAHIKEQGLQEDGVLGASLVNMYAKCCSLEDAEDVFNKLSAKNVVAWTTMIAGYVQQGMGQEALSLYCNMQQEGLTRPDSVTYVCLLQACATVGLAALEQGKQLHEQIRERGLQENENISRSLVNMYAKCGRLDEARTVFDKLSNRDVVTWTAMIAGYSQQGFGQEALSLHRTMRQESCTTPNSVTYVCLLQACASIGVEALHEGRQLHAEIKKQGLQEDMVLGGSLVNMYAKCGSLEDARQEFDRLSEKNVVAWNAIISGYAQQGMGQQALTLYKSMRAEGLTPDCFTYIPLLQACASVGAGALDEGKQLHARIKQQGLEEDGVLGISLVNMYAKCCSLEDARIVFEKLPMRSLVAWNAIIAGYAQHGMGEDALGLYRRLQQEGLTPDSVTYVCLLQACASIGSGALYDGKQLHAQLTDLGLEEDAVLGSCLVNMHAKCGNLADARILFEKLPEKNLVAWNAMIAGYVQQGIGEDALRLYSRLQKTDLTPDSVTYVCLLQACAAVAALPLGQQLHDGIEERGLQSDIILGAALVNMYAKCGSMYDSQRVFESLPEKSVEAWGALVSGYARQGDSELVFDLLDRMKSEGVRPDEITCLSVLTVCSHVGLVDKGREFFDAMTTRYGINLTMEHFICMVDLLGRAGHLDEALQMAKSMPFPPNDVVWRTLLGACRKWKNVEIGQQAFRGAISVDDKDAASYVLMSSIYASIQMWEDAKEMQAKRTKLGAWKKPGQSWWTDMDGVVHAFLVGDKKHPDSKDIYARLDQLIPKMKKEGYVPHLESSLLDISDDEKQTELCGHSEKLAIAYALNKTADGATIRIVKNLRVCEDCHIATGYISKVEKRTIICRDASRFHVFKDGKCSCGDYW